MTPALRVISPGLLTTIQDLGRPGHQHLGIPVSGALDPVSLRAANALVGNAPGTGSRSKWPTSGRRLPSRPTTCGCRSSARKPPSKCFPTTTASAGTLVEHDGEHSVCGAATSCASVRCGKQRMLYVAVEGGFDIAPVLGSVSTYIRGGIGGWQGRALAAGDLLPLVQNTATERDEFRLDGLDLSAPERFRVIAGPQSDYFSAQSLARFFDSEYTVGAGSDRMGMRLDGPQIDHAARL